MSNIPCFREKEAKRQLSPRTRAIKVETFQLVQPTVKCTRHPRRVTMHCSGFRFDLNMYQHMSLLILRGVYNFAFSPPKSTKRDKYILRTALTENQLRYSSITCKQWQMKQELALLGKCKKLLDNWISDYFSEKRQFSQFLIHFIFP